MYTDEENTKHFSGKADSEKNYIENDKIISEAVEERIRANFEPLNEQQNL